MGSKLQAVTAKKPPNAGKGRPKGAKNKVNADLKAMIQGALADAGGRKYLTEQARANPSAFLSLLGRILPREIAGAIDLKFPDAIKVHALG